MDSTIKKIKLEDMSSLSKKDGEQLLFEAGYYESYKKDVVFDINLEDEDDSEWDYVRKTFYFLKNDSGNVIDKKCFSEYIENVFEDPNSLNDIGFVRDFAWEEI